MVRKAGRKGFCLWANTNVATGPGKTEDGRRIRDELQSSKISPQRLLSASQSPLPRQCHQLPIKCPKHMDLREASHFHTILIIKFNFSKMFPNLRTVVKLTRCYKLCLVSLRDNIRICGMWVLGVRLVLFEPPAVTPTPCFSFPRTLENLVVRYTESCSVLTPHNVIISLRVMLKAAGLACTLWCES